MITFAQFMEEALYGADGYYSAGHARTGARGDYFTAPETGAVFGQLLGTIFMQWQKRLKANPFSVVEVGAGEGQLMQAMMDGVASPGLWPPSPIPPVRSWSMTPLPEKQGRGASRERGMSASSLSCEGEGWGEAMVYAVIERSASRREKIRQLNLPVQIHGDFSEMKKTVDGVIFANELIDAFPVHRVRMNKGKLEEAFVEQRVLIWGAPSTPRIAAYFNRLNITLPEGYETEINLAMADWLRDASAVLNRGLMVLIDYGRPAWDYYAEERTMGTLRCFSQHRVFQPFVDDVIARECNERSNLSSRDDRLLRQNEAPRNDGNGVDWTADVDFTSLALDAKEAGLEPLAFMEMGTFLKMGIVGAGHRPRPQSQSQSQSQSESQLGLESSLGLNRDGGRGRCPAPTGLKYLLHPDGLGTQFHVLILGKNIDSAEWVFEHNRISRLGLSK